MPATYPECDMLREKLRPLPVELNKTPNWFRRRLLRRYGPQRGGYTGAYWMLDQLKKALGNKTSVLDHWGQVRFADGTTGFACEPYIGTEDAIRIGRFIAGELGCACIVSENSYWFPQNTVTILFFEGPKSKPIDEIERVQPAELSWA